MKTDKEMLKDIEKDYERFQKEEFDEECDLVPFPVLLNWVLQREKKARAQGVGSERDNCVMCRNEEGVYDWCIGNGKSFGPFGEKCWPYFLSKFDLCGCDVCKELQTTPDKQTGSKELTSRARGVVSLGGSNPRPSKKEVEKE